MYIYLRIIKKGVDPSFLRIHPEASRNNAVAYTTLGVKLHKRQGLRLCQCTPRAVSYVTEGVLAAPSFFSRICSHTCILSAYIALYIPIGICLHIVSRHLYSHTYLYFLQSYTPLYSEIYVLLSVATFIYPYTIFSYETRPQLYWARSLL